MSKTVIHMVATSATSHYVEVHAHEDQDEANGCRSNCKHGGYHVSADVTTTLPLTTKHFELIEDIVNAVREMSV